LAVTTNVNTAVISLDICSNLDEHSTTNTVQNDDYVAICDTSAGSEKKARIEDIRKLESILLSQNDFSGTIVRLTAGVAITAGDALALSRTTGGRVVKARANASNTLTPCMGIAVTSQANIGSSVDVLLMGIVNNSTFPFTSSDIGKPVFVSSNSGDLTVTAPSGPSHKVQVVGIVINGGVSKQILFNPSYNIITV
jgi:hypothetical protein